jgi:CDP-diglyceride synthetase
MLGLINTIVLLWVAQRLEAPTWVVHLLIFGLASVITSFVHGLMIGFRRAKARKEIINGRRKRTERDSTTENR